MNNPDEHIRRRQSFWYSGPSEPHRKNQVRFRSSESFIPQDMIHPDLRGANDYRVPPLSPHYVVDRNGPHRYFEDPYEILRNDHYGEEYLYPAKTGGRHKQQRSYGREEFSSYENRSNRYSDYFKPNIREGYHSYMPSLYDSDPSKPPSMTLFNKNENHRVPSVKSEVRYNRGRIYETSDRPTEVTRIPPDNRRAPNDWHACRPHSLDAILNSVPPVYGDCRSNRIERCDHSTQITRGRVPHDNTTATDDWHDYRPHSHDSIPNIGHKGTKTDYHKFDRGPCAPWGDEDMWKNIKRHNSLPSLDNNRLHSLTLPCDGYHEKTTEEQRHWQQQCQWNDTLIMDLDALRFLAIPRNAVSFIEGFVTSCIQEDLILDVAAEVLVETRELQEVLDRTPYPVIMATKDVLHECLDAELVTIAKGELQNAVSRYWKDVASRTDLLQPIRDDLLYNAVESELRLVAANAVAELVNDYFREKDVVNVYSLLYDEVTQPLQYELVHETLLDLHLDSIVEGLIDDETKDVGSNFVAGMCSRWQLPLTDQEKAIESEEKSENAAKHQAEYENNATMFDGKVLEQLNQTLKIREFDEMNKETSHVKENCDNAADDQQRKSLRIDGMPLADDELSRQDGTEAELEALVDSPNSTPGYSL